MRKYRTKKFHARKYIGGPLDGLSDAVPIRRGVKLRPFINKSHWPFGGAGKAVSNFYVLAEPVHKPLDGEVLIYEYQPDFRPAPDWKTLQLIPVSCIK